MNVYCTVYFETAVQYNKLLDQMYYEFKVYEKYNVLSNLDIIESKYSSNGLACRRV